VSAWEAMGESDEWYTPAYIFDALGCRFFLDVAAPRVGPRHVPCDQWYWERGIESEWSGFVWCNPPFGCRNGLEPWLGKFFDHGNGIALVPDRTSAPWFQRAAKQANALLFLSPKVKFERPDGSVGKSPGCGTVLMSAGSRGRAALFRAGRLGFVALPNAGADDSHPVKAAAPAPHLQSAEPA
jgi:hypothetical protein